MNTAHPMRRASDRAQALERPFPRSREEAAVAMDGRNGTGSRVEPIDDRPKMTRLHHDLGGLLHASDQVLMLSRRIAGRVIGDQDGQIKQELELFGSELTDAFPSNEDGDLDKADRAVRTASAMLTRSYHHLTRVERELGEV